MNLAIFGGTFDPIHSGHVAAAVSVADAFAIDRVLVIPSGNRRTRPAAAKPTTSTATGMVESACSADARLTPSRIEAPGEPGQRHYSYDTIRRIKRQFAFDDPLRFIVGSDAFAEVRLWRRWDDVAREVEFIVVSRPGDRSEEPAPEGIRAQWRKGPMNPASSSEIRHRVKIGGSLLDMVPADVCDYIREHRLYRPF